VSDTRNKTCEERIDSHLASRAGDLADIFAVIDGETQRYEGEVYNEDDAVEILDEWALALDLTVTMKVVIGTGGPGDQFEVEITRGRYGWELAENEATYRFLDWGDGATRSTRDPAVMRYLEMMVERISPEWGGE
jgi:hypothetical protein